LRDTGNLVISRKAKTTGSFHSVQVFIDEQPMGDVKDGGVLNIELPAGSHAVQVAGGGMSRTVNVAIGKGQVLHFQTYFSNLGILGGGLNLDPTDPPPTTVIHNSLAAKRSAIVAPLPSAVSLPQPQQPVPAEITRICELCGESIPQKALNCPHCGNWRKGIARDRRIMVGAAAASIFIAVGVILGAIAGAESGQWCGQRMTTEYSFPVIGGPNAGQWVTKTSPSIVPGDRVFYMTIFLHSSTGWGLIIAAILALALLAMSQLARANLNRKMGGF
jgi:hypothetical protein